MFTDSLSTPHTRILLAEKSQKKTVKKVKEKSAFFFFRAVSFTDIMMIVSLWMCLGHDNHGDNLFMWQPSLKRR